MIKKNTKIIYENRNLFDKMNITITTDKRKLIIFYKHRYLQIKISKDFKTNTCNNQETWIRQNQLDVGTGSGKRAIKD
jgi:hypothetical protein